MADFSDAETDADTVFIFSRRGLVESYFADAESQLLETAKVLRHSGHRIHSGTVREVFVRDFLLRHLSERVGAGSGEIINSTSNVGDRRHQLDVVIHDRQYPRLDFGGDIRAYMAESVIAVLEVKSKLDRRGLKQAMVAARDVKALSRSYVRTRPKRFEESVQLRPNLRYYIVAFGGPTDLGHVQGWISSLDTDLGIAYATLPPTNSGRATIQSPTIDGVFVLGKGYIQFDNHPLSFVSDEDRSAHPDMKWEIVQNARVGLHHLFMLLTMEAEARTAWELDAEPYIRHVSVTKGDVRFVP